MGDSIGHHGTPRGSPWENPWDTMRVLYHGNIKSRYPFSITLINITFMNQGYWGVVYIPVVTKICPPNHSIIYNYIKKIEIFFES